MKTIVAMSGSLRKNSYNSGLLRAAKELTPKDIHVEILNISDIPLYNADLEEAEGVPAIVETIKNQIAQADGIIFSTPEYNNGIPGVMKNALDWLSRPAEDITRVFHGKPFALMGASTSRFGTLNAQTSWLPILRLLKLRPFFQNPMMISAAHNVFDENVNLIDDSIRKNLEKFMSDFSFVL